MTIANLEMAKAWDGPEGEYWAENAERYERTSRRHVQLLLEASSIAEHENVLDVGCGTGKATLAAARSARSGSALGVDLSAKMLERARRSAESEGVSNVRFEQADAQVHPFPPAAFDVVISNFGAMFFADPVAAFANIGRAMRPDGRMLLLAWRDLGRNEWVTAIRGALSVAGPLPEPPPNAPGPFGLADADHVRRVLEAARFADVTLEEVDQPIELGRDADDAFSFVSGFGFTRGVTQDMDADQKDRALQALSRTMVEHETDDGVLFGTSAWLITARPGPRRGANPGPS
jgi:SAM-dependent methyltransferase